MTHTSGGYYSF